MIVGHTFDMVRRSKQNRQELKIRQEKRKKLRSMRSISVSKQQYPNSVQEIPNKEILRVKESIRETARKQRRKQAVLSFVILLVVAVLIGILLITVFN